MKLDYRSIARTARNHAEHELQAMSNPRIRYAALELRTAMEALVYERLLLYETELPEAELATWQPKRVFEVLLELNPNADQSASIAVAEESSLGVRSGPFHCLGNERVISMKELKTYYDKIGSYLHAPTVQQVKSGPTATPEQMRQRCHEVLNVIDQILSSKVWALDFKHAATMPCEECKAIIVCRMLNKPGESRVVDCTRCKASYRVEPGEGVRVTWYPLQHTLKCRGPDCAESRVVWEREIELDRKWACTKCGGLNRFVIALAYLPPETPTDATR